MPAIKPVYSRITDLFDAAKIGGGKLLFVDGTNGNDTTGARGRRELPFATCTAAKAAASSGDTIIVQPGTYNEHDLAKDGVNWHFQNGASVAYVAVVSDSTAVPGIFDDNGGAMTFTVTGAGVFSMSLTESSANVANHITVWAVSITAASTVRIEGRSITCTTAFRSAFVTLNTGKSVRQSAGTFVCVVDDPLTATVSGGTAKFVSNGTNAAITAAGGTVDVVAPTPASLSCSSGTLRAAFDTATSIACSGGTMRLRGQRADSINHSGGDLYDDVFHVGSLSRTGSSGNSYHRVSVWGDGSAEAIHVNQSGTAKTFIFGGSLESSHSTCATLSGGTIRVYDLDVRCTAPTGAHGTDIAIGAGDSSGVNATDLTMQNVIVRVNDSTHSCWRVYSEDPGPSTYRVIGGTFQAGSAGYWFDPENTCAVKMRGVISVNRPSGPFVTLGGSGTLVTDSTMAL